MKFVDLNKKSWQYLFLLVLALLWGSSFILMKKGLRNFDNVQVASFRVFFAHLLLLPLSLRYIRRITRQNWLDLALVGFIGTLIPAFLFTTAQTHITSSLAGMLNSLTPFFTLLVGMVFFHSGYTKMQVIGLLIGLIGAFGLVVDDFSHIFQSINLYSVPVLIATICYGFNVNIIKNRLATLSGVEITALSFVFIGPVSLIALSFTGVKTNLLEPTAWGSLAYIFILSLFSSVIAVLIFNILIKYTTGIFASSVTYIIPIFALGWGALDHEKVQPVQLLWIAIVLAGVYMVNSHIDFSLRRQLKRLTHR